MSLNTIWLASYPKSGNTWARAVLSVLIGDRRAGEAPVSSWDDHLVDINALSTGSMAASRAQIETLIGFSSSDLTADEIDALRPAFDVAFNAKLRSVRFRKIHDALRSGPQGRPIVAPEVTRGAIYLVRDPRDVAVSFAHHGGRSPAWTVASMADPTTLLEGGIGLGPQTRQRLDTWSAHVTGWIDAGLFPVLVVRYEDLHADPVGQFTTMAAFAGLDCDEGAVQRAVEAAQFDKLRAQEHTNGFRERPPRAGQFFRRGIAGAWRDELPAEQARQVERDHADVMRRLGYLSATAPVG